MLPCRMPPRGKSVKYPGANTNAKGAQIMNCFQFPEYTPYRIALMTAPAIPTERKTLTAFDKGIGFQSKRRQPILLTRTVPD
ncbi:MAG: hypothetical protein C0469_16655 [Cyanobacteria bacterium DS2.3.42]|nr:hypothetical protein [Cyanobacteria bacterium DS2.3.42]